MGLRLSGLCRGDGKIYLRVIPGSVEGKIIATAKYQEKCVVPCSVYRKLAHAGHDDTYIVVLPILIVSHVRLTITEIDKSENPIQHRDINFSYSVAKWKSRFNYQFNKKLCSTIRDYDQIGTYSKIGMELWDCIPDKTKNILRGVLRMPSSSTSIDIKCMTAKLESVVINPIFLNDATLKSDVADDVYVREVQFSVRLPKEPQDLIFIFKDSVNSELDSFEVLEKHVYSSLVSSNADLMRNAQIDPSYNTWFKEHKADLGTLAKQCEHYFKYRPLFSFVVPLFKTPKDFYTDMVDSVVSQTYGRWELILVNASQEDQALSRLVHESTKHDQRIKALTLSSNRGISENTNAGIGVASGEFICFLDHDDVIEPDLLFEYAKALNSYNDIDVIYCDEDKLLKSGKLVEPLFKPDFSIDLLRYFNYVCHMLAIRRTLLDTLVPNTSEFDGAQDHNLTLQASEHTRCIYHVPKVLYHWRVDESSIAPGAESKPYATRAGFAAVRGHLERLGLKTLVAQSSLPFTYRVTYLPPEDSPLVSIIIPSKDHKDVLNICIESIIEKTTYSNYEIVIIENNSTEPETFDYYSELVDESQARVRVEYWPGEFNFSKLMNFGVRKAAGDYLVLLNNDTEVITPTWIDQMLGICSREDVGAVGVRLYFKDETIQHAGVCITGRSAGIIGRNLPKQNSAGYFGIGNATQDLSAVTAACMMTKRGVYEGVGGFSEELVVAFNDVDYCLKVREKDLLVVYTPNVELFHYESLSRGLENNTEKLIRFYREASYLNYRWAKYYVNGDPYINPNFDGNDPFNCYYHL